MAFDPLQEAIEYFHSRGYEDKVRLLSYRRKTYLTLYRLGERMDYGLAVEYLFFCRDRARAGQQAH